MNFNGIFTGLRPAMALACLVGLAIGPAAKADPLMVYPDEKFGALAASEVEERSKLEIFRSKMIERRELVAQRMQERRQQQMDAWMRISERWKADAMNNAGKDKTALQSGKSGKRNARLGNSGWQNDGSENSPIIKASSIPRKKPAQIQVIKTSSDSAKPEVVKVHHSNPAPSGKYGKLIAKYAKQNGLPYSLARAVVQVESSFRANVTGQAGEIGLMQIKYETARGMGYKGSRKGLYDPATNLYWGMKYLGKAHRLAGGSTCGTILRYNAGHGAKKMNPISARYCKRIKGILA